MPPENNNNAFIIPTQTNPPDTQAVPEPGYPPDSPSPAPPTATPLFPRYSYLRRSFHQTPPPLTPVFLPFNKLVVSAHNPPLESLECFVFLIKNHRVRQYSIVPQLVEPIKHIHHHTPHNPSHSSRKLNCPRSMSLEKSTSSRGLPLWCKYSFDVVPETPSRINLSTRTASSQAFASVILILRHVLLS